MQNVIPSLVSVLVGILGWLLVTRRVALTDSELAKLRDERVRRIESDIASASAARKGLHEGVDAVRQTFVHKEECLQFRRDQAEQSRATVDKLAAVSEELAREGARNETIQKMNERLADQLIAAKEDVDRMVGRMEELKRG